MLAAVFSGASYGCFAGLVSQTGLLGLAAAGLPEGSLVVDWVLCFVSIAGGTGLLASSSRTDI